MALITRLGTTGPTAPSADDAPLARDQQLGSALAALSKREREALLLIAWEDLEPTQAARVVGCSAAAFRVRLHRARRKVAAQLERTDTAAPSPELFGDAP
jgi:RNA polymerase sigma-70 factor (ECF subfamily)